MNKLCQNSGKQSEVYRNQDSAESTQRQLQIVGKLCDLCACFYPNPTPGSVVILRMEACVPSMGCWSLVLKGEEPTLRSMNCVCLFYNVWGHYLKGWYKELVFVSANSEPMKVEKVVRIPWEQNNTKKQYVATWGKILQLRKIRALKTWGESWGESVWEIKALKSTCVCRGI